MNVVRVRPGPVTGTMAVPPSKSATHRAYLLAALSTHPATVAAPLRSTDTDATLHGLAALGALPEVRGDAVRFEPAPLRPPSAPIDCGGSGTTLRFLAAQAARLGVAVAFDGDASLRRRPSAPLLDALSQAGAQVHAPSACPPWTVRGPLRPGAISLRGGEGSQAASALLLALPFAAAESRLAVTGPVASRPYIDLTLAMARAAGLRFTDEGTPGDGLAITIPGQQAPRAGAVRVEGDWSAAAVPAVAAALTGGTVTLTGLEPKSAQGDRAILRAVQASGATVRWQGGKVTVSGRDGGPRPFGDWDAGATPDLVPALAVLAAATPGVTRLKGAAHLRLKESDRIRAMAVGLRAFGVRCEETPDGLAIHGGALRSPSAPVPVQGDHRIHMALAVAALAAPAGAAIEDPGCVAKSHPGFHADLARLGVGLEDAAEATA